MSSDSNKIFLTIFAYVIRKCLFFVTVRYIVDKAVYTSSTVFQDLFFWRHIPQIFRAGTTRLVGFWIALLRHNLFLYRVINAKFIPEEPEEYLLFQGVVLSSVVWAACNNTDWPFLRCELFAYVFLCCWPLEQKAGTKTRLENVVTYNQLNICW